MPPPLGVNQMGEVITFLQALSTGLGESALSHINPIALLFCSIESHLSESPSSRSKLGWFLRKMDLFPNVPMALEPDLLEPR